MLPVIVTSNPALGTTPSFWELHAKEFVTLDKQILHRVAKSNLIFSVVSYLYLLA